MVVKFWMSFQSSVPDFGSIERVCDGSFVLLAADISKLNSALTRTVCQPLLTAGGMFSVDSGTSAIVLDAPALWMYHGGTDTWYEVIPEDE